MRRVGTQFLLFFTLYLLFSMVAIAYDYDDATKAKACPTCFARGSLSSAVGESTFVPQIDIQLLFQFLVEGVGPFRSTDHVSWASYRGPPAFAVSSIGI